MRIEYGHVKAKFKGIELTFVPSLSNISKIGSPTEIIDAFSDVYAINAREWFSENLIYDKDVAKRVMRDAGTKALKASILILSCCCDEEITALVGGYKSARGKMYYQPGFESTENIVTLAQIMLKHGVIGKSKKKSTNKNAKKMSEFNAAEYADMARVHLNMSRDEAWNLTMTEWVSLFEAKFPSEEDRERQEKEKKQFRLDRKEYDKRMKEAREIRAKIAKSKEVKNG